jgi:drug/metabolite transporter (DMT)-like permease
MASQKTRFWAGNIVLVVALVVMFNMGSLSERYGMGAVVLWMGLVALGFYLILSGKEPPGSMPE